MRTDEGPSTSAAAKTNQLALINEVAPPIEEQLTAQQQKNKFNLRWLNCNKHFNKFFLENDFGCVCSICDRIWFQKDLKPSTSANITFLQPHFENVNLNNILLCRTCRCALQKKKIPPLAKINGFFYPRKPMHLPSLDPISERLISPRLPFMQIRRLRYEGNYSIIGQVINVPVDVNNMVCQLPRRLDDDYTINVNIKKNLIHKSVYLNGFVKKSVIRAWLAFLMETPLYKYYNICVDFNVLDGLGQNIKNATNEIGNLIECGMECSMADSDILVAKQHTIAWNEDFCLNIAPGQNKIPLNIIYDQYAEELSFPAIYYGQPRKFNSNVQVTPYMIATSEIRRSDRRGVTPQHILYMAMKILRLRVMDGIQNTFRCVPSNMTITRRMLEDKQFMEDSVEKNLSFIKSIPNSVQYWVDRKRDVFALIRQLGKFKI